MNCLLLLSRTLVRYIRRATTNCFFAYTHPYIGIMICVWYLNRRSMKPERNSAQQTIFHLILGTVTLFWNFSVFWRSSVIYSMFSRSLDVQTDTKRICNSMPSFPSIFFLFFSISFLEYFHFNGPNEVMFMWGPFSNRNWIFFLQILFTFSLGDRAQQHYLSRLRLHNVVQ